MILADTSAWIAFQHDADSPVSAALRSWLRDRGVATTDLVVAEFLGGLHPARVERWTSVLSATAHLAHQPWDDAMSAAEIYRSCRAQGHTPRSMVDCIIAAIALRNDVPVLHDDRDYDAIAQCCGVQVVRS